MNSRTKMTTLNLILGAAVILLTTACGKIPKGYQGEYVDAASGATLKLEASEGTIKMADGRTLKSKAEDAKLEELKEAKQGLFLGELNGNNVDVFFLVPNASTRQQGGSHTWYESEIFYGQMNSKQEDKVPGIAFHYCKNGTVQIDSARNDFIVGCPAGPGVFNFMRGGEKKSAEAQPIERL